MQPHASRQHVCGAAGARQADLLDGAADEVEAGPPRGGAVLVAVAESDGGEDGEERAQGGLQRGGEGAVVFCAGA